MDSAGAGRGPGTVASSAEVRRSRQRVGDGSDDRPFLVIGNVRPAPPVARQPLTVPAPWWVLARGGCHHIVGLTTYGSWRTSTPLVAWDPESRLAETESGRNYLLAPAHAAREALGKELWTILAEIGVVDVTHAYLRRSGREG